MRAALPRSIRPRSRSRRGVTLVEMLVVVALVILMMTILVQIFQAAGGAMQVSRAIQELDVTLRQVDLRLRQDLAGVTARFTPPLDPTLKLGYFEYGENAFADAHGEDTDDYMAFTTKAPEGQVFTGRLFIPNNIPGRIGVAGNVSIQPVTITSQLAEIVYFLRNGNLYRRVFLIVPDRQGSLSTAAKPYPFYALSPNATVSWIGVNDLSVRPASVGSGLASVPNDLGSLTNRENRAFRPRFRSDFFNNANFTTNPPGDGYDDDFNSDDIPDFYPTLYPGALAQNPGLVNEAAYPNNSNPRSIASYDVHAFPYIYPGMFSKPESIAPYSMANGWIHSLDPSHATYVAPNVPFTGNQSPLYSGDNLKTPNPNVPGQVQTWWGFPTWRETLSTNWHDPVVGLVGFKQQLGLNPFPPMATPVAGSATFLPSVTTQYANDGAGSGSFTLPAAISQGIWDDDLILTNVRSLDIKAYDPDAPLYINAPFVPSAGYYDLGFALQGTPGLGSATPTTLWGSDNQPQGFGHAGRIPPLVNDFRLNPSRNYVGNGSGGLLANNVGDDGAAAGVIRLTRVWDSWSTDYTNAPDVDINLNGYPGNTPPLDRPIYPSYPAPYTSPLRGIQIQIRVADPRNEHVKVLTIRQDFTDKL